MYQTKKFIVSIDEDGRVAIADSERTSSRNCSPPPFLRSFLLFSFHRLGSNSERPTGMLRFCCLFAFELPLFLPLSTLRCVTPYRSPERPSTAHLCGPHEMFRHTMKIYSFARSLHLRRPRSGSRRPEPEKRITE